MSTVEKTFYDATQCCDIAQVLSLLMVNPGLNVNWADESEYSLTSFHWAAPMAVLKL